MKKTLRIEVDCANCANSIENAIKKINGIKNVIVNFMTQKMILEFEENVDSKAIMDVVIKECKKVEPDCEVYL